jgi:hypothetical protein
MSRSRVGPSDGTLQTSTLRLPGVPGRGRFALSPRGMAVMLVGNQLWAESRPGPDSPGVMQPVTLPNMELQPSSRLTFCDDRTLVISSGTKVVAFTGLDAGAPLANDDEAPAIRRAWEVDVFFPIGALVPATKTFEPAGGHAVYVFDPDLVIGRKVAGYMEASQQNIIVPKLMGLPPNSAMQTTIVQDRMGTLWFARDLGQINGLLPDGNVLFGSAGGNIEGLSIDDSDQLLAVDNGLVRCLRITPTGLVDAPAGSSPFTGLAVGKGFQALRSSTNYEPRLHSGPRWLNTIDPPPVAACPADVNDDGLVDGGDLSAVLATWGPSTPGQSNAADLNGDGLVDGNDLSAILATWGPCPR